MTTPPMIALTVTCVAVGVALLIGTIVVIIEEVIMRKK